jgi:hypothetical protein
MQAPRVRNFTEVEAAWLGAIIAGEGSVTHQTGVGSTGWRLQVGNTEAWIIDRIIGITGIGGVFVRPPNGQLGGTRPMFLWSLTRISDLLYLRGRLAPYCRKLDKVC